MGKRVMIKEAWFNCAQHGMQHHPLAPDVAHPCPQCELAMTKAASEKLGVLLDGDTDRPEQAKDE